MNKIFMIVAALLLTVSICYSADEIKLKANEPVGAMVETSGIAVGRVTSIVEKSLGGGTKENSLVMADDEGRTRIIPLDDTVKALDITFNAITLNQLKGKKVSVVVSEKSGKATQIQEVE